ncbi:MAG TPA: MOSC domain-containing protein [Bacteroidetes bacterium]|nr:MOSC domain-containing protein [Bacteroidota bacterium]
MSNLKKLMQTIPQVGKVEWMSIRPKKRDAVKEVEELMASEKEGLAGDHYSGRSGKRQVTLIQKEHLDTIASILKKEIEPSLTRRNIVVSGINLLALKDMKFRVGEVELQMTGLCHPCTRMEENFGPGGYNAMRGHGGITAKILKGGNIKIGDEVKLIKAD